MSLKAVLFDLDGTLLPMEQDTFTNAYFSSISGYLSQYGYHPKILVKAIWQGVSAMIKNDGVNTNETVFWQALSAVLGEKCLSDGSKFDKYYDACFDSLRSVCGCNPKAAETVKALKSKGLCLVLATNPIFPRVATEKRVNWAGLSPSDFELITSYESVGFTKPNVKYFEEILSLTGVSADECLMVGNDTGDDLPALKAGIDVFMLTDCLINSKGVDISRYSHGSFDDLNDYIVSRL